MVRAFCRKRPGGPDGDQAISSESGCRCSSPRLPHSASSCSARLARSLARDACGSNRRSTEHHRHSRGRHGMVRHRPVWQRDSHAESRRARRARRPIHTVLQHAAMLADARQSPDRCVPAPGGDGPSRRRRPQGLGRHDRAAQRSLRHHCRSVARGGLLHRHVRQVASRSGQRVAAVAARVRSCAQPAPGRHVLSQPELPGRWRYAHPARARAAVRRRHTDAARFGHVR